jgi:hypothetical protein
MRWQFDALKGLADLRMVAFARSNGGGASNMLRESRVAV